MGSMRYMLLIYGEEQAWTDAERQSCYVESTQLVQQIHANGNYLASRAAAVRVHGHLACGFATASAW